MTCLYRIGDEICIELSYGALGYIEAVVRERIHEYGGPSSKPTKAELINFVNMVRAHLQHPEPACKLAPLDNSDLL